MSRATQLVSKEARGLYFPFTTLFLNIIKKIYYFYLTGVGEGGEASLSNFLCFLRICPVLILNVNILNYGSVFLFIRVH
jgi:hypothetical protein